jgi:hypothetical protein
MTGDKMKALMLTLLFMVRDLIAPKELVPEYMLICQCVSLLCNI